jgi:ferrous iron transport protein B
MAKSTKKIALLGNPNSGKTALFNILTGLNQKVSNYPGVTVEQTFGMAKFETTMVQVHDLPGTYSLVPESQDEVIVSQEIIKWVQGESAPDCIVSIVDSTNLERNLYLTSQLTDLGIPIVIALNMTDLAREKQLEVDGSKIKKSLGVSSVVPISARLNEGIDLLKKNIVNACRETQPNATFFPIP